MTIEAVINPYKMEIPCTACGSDHTACEEVSRNLIMFRCQKCRKAMWITRPYFEADESVTAAAAMVLEQWEG